MSNRSHGLGDVLHAYLVEQTVRETDVMRRLRAETARLPLCQMQISPEQGQFMRWLLEVLAARRALEIGTFTGYSALCIAEALPPDGRLTCCDINAEWTDIARRYWRAAGVDGKIDLRLQPALKTLADLLGEGRQGAFDFIFIDADKANVDAYYERSLVLLRPGGVVAIDNAFKEGRVADPADTHPDVAALRAINAKAAQDARVTASLVPISDGLLLVRKH